MREVKLVNFIELLFVYVCALWSQIISFVIGWGNRVYYFKSLDKNLHLKSHGDVKYVNGSKKLEYLHWHIDAYDNLFYQNLVFLEI